VALQPSLWPFPPVFLPQSLVSLAIACQFFILSSLVPSFRSLPSHLFLNFPVVLLPPRPSSRICFGIPLSNILTTKVAQKVIPHISSLGNYLFRIYEIHAQYNWMFPVCILFFHIISIYVYSLMPVRNKSMHAFPVPARFLFT